MRFCRGFALPIVILLSAVASSILAYDLHRLQAQGQISRMALVKDHVLLIFEVESQTFIEQLNHQLAEDQCRLQDVHSDPSSCDFELQNLIKSFRFSDDNYKLKISALQADTAHNAIDTVLYGALALSMEVASNGQQFSWHRYGYISSKQNAEGMLMFERSQLVQFL